MNCPSVYINAEASTVLVAKVSASTVYAVCITDSAERDLKSFRIMDFLAQYKPISYCPTKAAQKMLLSKIISCTNSAQKTLKEIIMNNSANVSTVLVVTRTAEFVGRFVDAHTAAACSSSTDLIITSSSDFDQFSKSQLLDCLYLGNSERPNETQLKNITKKTLADQLFEVYTTKEFTIIMSDTAKAKEPTTKTVRADSVMSKVIAQLENGEVLTIAAIVKAHGCSEGSAASILSNMQSEKYMKNNPIVAIVSGRIDGITSYVLADKSEGIVFDAKKSATRTTSDAPKVKGLKAIIRELLMDDSDGYTMDELIEATGSCKKLISDMLAYVKNPKYAGAIGPIGITKIEGKFKGFEVINTPVENTDTSL